MAEYIEREKVLELMRSVSRDIEDVPENAFPKDYADGWEDGLETAADKVECLFAADVRPERHGRWVSWEEAGNFIPSSERYECSVCHDAAQRLCNGIDLLSDYCPNCGAKMDGKDGDDNDKL